MSALATVKYEVTIWVIGIQIARDVLSYRDAQATRRWNQEVPNITVKIKAVI